MDVFQETPVKNFFGPILYAVVLHGLMVCGLYFLVWILKFQEELPPKPQTAAIRLVAAPSLQSQSSSSQGTSFKNNFVKQVKPTSNETFLNNAQSHFSSSVSQGETAVVAAAEDSIVDVKVSDQAQGASAVFTENTILEAQYLHKTPPDYPRRALALGQQGTVILHVEVALDGRPRALKIVESSGYQLLDLAAVSAVKQWEFRPLHQNGQPTISWVRVPVQFKIRN